MSLRVAITVLPLSLIFTGFTASAEPPPAAPGRQSLLERMAEFPSNQVKTQVVRVVFPHGFKTPLHTHEGPGPRYVVRGRVKIEEAGVIKIYGPGDVFWETGQWMSAENVGDGEAELIAFELKSAK